MKATEAKLLEFLRKSSQFIIPIYQRTYSWTEPECQQLWNDILRTGQNDDISAHFIGSIVYIEKEYLPCYKPTAATCHRWTTAADDSFTHPRSSRSRTWQYRTY